MHVSEYAQEARTLQLPFLSLRTRARYHWVSKNDLTRASPATRVMPAVIWSGRLVRLDESDKLKDVPGKLVPEENIQRLENVQSAVSDSSARYDPDNDRCTS